MAKSKSSKRRAKAAVEPLEVLTTLESRKPIFSNLAIIQHTEEEFILEFLFKARSEVQHVARIILSPDHAKRLLNALQANVAKFEKSARAK